MKSKHLLQLTVVALCSASTHADEILLKNGDRLTGTILNKSGKFLELKTDYAAKVVIKWEAIKTLKTDKPLDITLSDKQELTGVVNTAADGSLTLNSQGVYQTQPIALQNIAEINKKFFSGGVNLGGNLAGGNTNRNSYHGDADVILRGRDDKVSFGGQYNYADSQANGINSLNARNFQLYGNYAHFFSPKWYGYAHGLFTSDRLQDIQLRSAFGVGAGYELFSSEDLNLSFEAGPDYVSVNRYDHPYGYGLQNPTLCNNTPGSKNPCNLDDETSIAGRWAVNYDQFFFNRSVQLFHKHEGIIGNGIFVRTRTGFHVPLWNGFQFTNEIQVDYYDKNADFGKKSLDTRYLFTLGYGW